MTDQSPGAYRGRKIKEGACLAVIEAKRIAARGGVLE
jgi:hypothetical protein